ncbi:MAG: hypothetical protein IKI09_12850 [Bacteroidales bacterium]|nr:hypothetical protein [Bacteroidales bacterium]
MSNNLAFITSINAAKLRLLSELDEGNEKTYIFEAMKYHHKTYKTCKTSMNMLAAPQPCRRREAAGWRASPTPTKGFEGFACFVTKNELSL